MKFINIYKTDEQIRAEATKRYFAACDRYDPVAAGMQPMPTLDEMFARDIRRRDKKIAAINDAINLYGNAYNDVAVKAATDPDFYLKGIEYQIEKAREKAGIVLLRGRRRDVESHNAPILVIESYIHALATHTMNNAGKKLNDIATIMEGVTEYQSIDE